MTPLRELLTRARQLPPRRLPRAVGRYALRTARARARRWVVTRSRGELSDQAFLRAVGCESPPDAVALFRQGGRPAFFVRDPSDARQRAEAIATA